MKEIYNFICSKLFFKHFLIACSILIGFVIVVMFALKIYTHHGQAFIVPQLKGLTVEEAAQILADKGLNYQVIDSVFRPDMKKGVIVEQNPPANFKVKANRTIFLTVNAMNAAKIKMPDLVGLSLRQAKSTIEAQGLIMGNISYAPDIALNIVLNQKINGNIVSAGTDVEKGSVVDLVLGSGNASGQLAVPELLGLTLDNAKHILENAMLNIGTITFDKTVKSPQDKATAVIWKQDPMPDGNGESPERGSSVNLWLTKDVNKVSTESPKETSPGSTQKESDEEDNF